MRLIITMLALALLSTPAYAVTVRNLSDTPKVVIVEQGGNAQEITLEPGGIHRHIGGDVSLQVPGQSPIHTDFYEEYAIWPDGKLILQKLHRGRGQAR